MILVKKEVRCRHGGNYSVKLSRSDLDDAIKQYLQNSGYVVAENGISYDQNFFLTDVSGAKVRVLNIANK